LENPADSGRESFLEVFCAVMHILYVTHGYKPAYRIGGPIWSVSAMAEGMAARGHRVTVFTTNSNLDEDLDVPVDQPVLVDDVEVWYFRHRDVIKKYFWWSKYFSQSMGFLFTPALAPAMEKLLPSVDVVHTQMPFVYPTMIAGRLAIAANKPLFYNQRGVFHPTRLGYRGLKKRLYIELFEKPIMRGARGLIALTADEIDSYRALGIRTPCHIVPNGIDVAQFRRKPRTASFPALGIGESDQVILFLGRLHPSKGVDLLVDAFFRLASQHPDSILVIAGPDEHGFSQKIQDQAVLQNLEHRIRIPGMVTGDLKTELLARADLFVLPSMGEGLSMAVLEALASGTPVILSPECNLPVVAEVKAGAIVERNVSLIAQAISRFLSDPALSEAASDAAYNLARDRFAWPSIVARLESIYNSAV
jgi:glycosyltransferase involved in cell wall biosynthesis